MRIDESGVYLDEIKLQDIGIEVLLSSEEPFLPGINRSTIRIPNRHGAYNYSAWLEPIDFKLSCLYQAKSYGDMKEMASRLKKMLLTTDGHPKPIKLRFEDAPDRYYLVEINSEIPTSKKALNVYFPLVFTAFDPVALSYSSNANITWGNEELTFNNDVYTLGHSGDGAKTFTEEGATSVTVSGDTVRPSLYVNGSGTDVQITWHGKTLTLGTFVDASWIIDFEQYTVLKDGAMALDEIGGDWLDMELVSGSNEITVDGSSLDFHLSFEFNDRFN